MRAGPVGQISALHLEFGHFWKEIPKGFHPKAQCCPSFVALRRGDEARATLGKKGEKGFNPNGVAAAENRSDATPLGLGQV